MRVLLDTNVILDALLNRQPFVAEAQQILQAVDRAQVSAYLTATTITDIFYLARKALGKGPTIKAINFCLDTFQICAVDKQTLQTAAKLKGNDFEDNLQIACAIASGLDAIVTRDKADFKTAAITVMEPAELLSRLSSSSSGATGSAGVTILATGYAVCAPRSRRRPDPAASGRFPRLHATAQHRGWFFAPNQNVGIGIPCQ